MKGKASIKGAIFEVNYKQWVPKLRLIEKNLCVLGFKWFFWLIIVEICNFNPSFIIAAYSQNLVPTAWHPKFWKSEIKLILSWNLFFIKICLITLNFWKFEHSIFYRFSVVVNWISHFRPILKISKNHIFGIYFLQNSLFHYMPTYFWV